AGRYVDGAAGHRVRAGKRADLVPPVPVHAVRERAITRGDANCRARRGDAAHAATYVGDLSQPAGGEVHAIHVAHAIPIAHEVHTAGTRCPLGIDLLRVRRFDERL